MTPASSAAHYSAACCCSAMLDTTALAARPRFPITTLYPHPTPLYRPPSFNSSRRALDPLLWRRGRLSGLFFPRVYASSAALVPQQAAGAEEGRAIEMPGPERTESGGFMPPPRGVITEGEVRAYMESETPGGRLRAMFTRGERGELSEELRFVVELTQQSCGMVFLITSLMGGWAARDTYIQKNKHTRYETRFQAFRAYNDAVFFGSMRMGIKWAFKTGFFCGLFLLTSQSIAVYRNKSSVLEYIAAGSLTCALLRSHLGLKGFVSGSVIGGALGLVGGASIYAVMLGADQTQEKRHYWRIHQTLRDQKEAALMSGALPPTTDSSPYKVPPTPVEGSAVAVAVS